jgi:hypothetical protein
MSTQEQQNKNKTTEEAGVDKKRSRFVAGASVAGPVILTLTSPSVLGQVECLSQQLSGNASQEPGGCELGYPPAYWKDPANSTKWAAAGFTYGVGIVNPPSTTDCNAYTGGTAFNDPSAFGTAPGCDIGSTIPADPMRKIMCDNPNSDAAIWAAAMLNTGLSANHIINYVFDRGDLLNLWFNHTPPPPFAATCADTIRFLKSTMGLPY